MGTDHLQRSPGQELAERVGAQLREDGVDVALRGPRRQNGQGEARGSAQAHQVEVACDFALLGGTVLNQQLQVSRIFLRTTLVRVVIGGVTDQVGEKVARVGYEHLGAKQRAVPRSALEDTSRVEPRASPWKEPPVQVYGQPAWARDEGSFVAPALHLGRVS